MDGLRAVLIGGTSHTGKSTIARLVADRLGFVCLSTDSLARHPGRPWRTRGREVPPHVAEHYGSLTVDQLIASVLEHYERLGPLIAERVRHHAVGDAGEDLVLEGSALLPGTVAGLGLPGTAAVWLTADASVLRSRIRLSSGRAGATDAERTLIDAFLSRTLRYQEQVLGTPAGPERLDSGRRTREECADAVVAAARAQLAQGPPAPDRR
ncbi:hypothetical protein [Streptomyces sp. TR06-5]|uniref:hypothetical protein n=1 Tax=Streptomyces sp. TR06-5 TaxID=3385976 RepID=UPI0039A1B185